MRIRDWALRSLKQIRAPQAYYRFQLRISRPIPDPPPHKRLDSSFCGMVRNRTKKNDKPQTSPMHHFFSFAAKQKAAVTRIRTWVITATT